MWVCNQADGVLLGASRKVAVELTYDDADPWAITAYVAGQRWIFARDLLATGCNEPAGEGDVQIRPDTGGIPDHLVLALSSPDGAAEIAIPRGTVESLLDTAEALVPTGDEHIDWAVEWGHLADGPAA
ncbi:SsgA family sporulation/cell division regulator [Amycolatopsis sp. NPDC051128]|uniref:SsgA family sporulation/cell division regulator n=1 Tax=Amycolatopsis sp. NPDC051128 TaxID=3155412 RepID=UPI00341E9970